MKIISARKESGTGNPLNMHKLEYLFILTIILVTTALILILGHPESLTSIDECIYLHLGKCIVEGNEYYHGFPDGRPIIPSIIALFLYLGFDIVAVRFLIPIIFMNSALISTYTLGKTLYGRKEAFIATLFLFTFPYFWLFGNATYVDIPLITFTTLFLLFFYLGIEKETKYLYISAILISIALLVKLTAILFIFPAFLYLIIRKKWDICRKKEFIISVMVIPLLFLSFYSLFHVFMSANMNFSEIERAANIPFRFYEILRLIYAPILVLAFFGISKEKRSIYLCLPIITFFVFWSIQGRFFYLRHFVSLLPIIGIFIGVGFFKLLNKYNKKFICILLIFLLAVSFVHAVYLQDYHKDTCWGITTLSNAVNELNGKVGFDEVTIGEYLRASTDTDIKGVFRISGQFPHALHTYDIVTDEWLHKNNIDYIILSIYGEQYRTKFENCFYPKYLMIEVPFMKICDYSRLPLSDFQFKSDLYNMCKKKYEHVDVIYRDGREIFIIYKIK